jgi:hypothetical protein
MSCVLREFLSAEYDVYASTETLVRPCSSKKLLISGLDTARCSFGLMDTHHLNFPVTGRVLVKKNPVKAGTGMPAKKTSSLWRLCRHSSSPALTPGPLEVNCVDLRPGSVNPPP